MIVYICPLNIQIELPSNHNRMLHSALDFHKSRRTRNIVVVEDEYHTRASDQTCVIAVSFCAIRLRKSSLAKAPFSAIEEVVVEDKPADRLASGAGGCM